MRRTIHSVLMTSALALLVAGTALAQEAIHVTQAEALRAAKDKQEPEYPSMARQLHLEGAVQVEAHIAENGSVEEVKPLTGNALLMNSAVAALRKWKFTPFIANGKPVKAIAEISFRFRL